MCVNKSEIIATVSEQLGHTRTQVTDIVDAFIEETKRAVARGERVAVSGFGIFDVAHRKARMGRNPQTGEAVKIKASKSPKFRPGAEFKAAVNGSSAAKKKAPAKKTAAKKKAPAKKTAAKKKAPAKKAAKKR
jgi:DNA-binding protein HU-beta